MVTFKLNGRSVSPRQLARELERDIRREVGKAADTHIQQAAHGIRCPIHHQTARVTPGKLGGYDVYGCCDALVAAVRKALA